MPLDLQIAKNLPEFALDISFQMGDAPLAILGPSGAGKTMLLRCVAGLERPDRGSISLNGRVLFDSEKRINLPARERRVGMLFQHYALFPHRTVSENIGFGLAHLSPEQQATRVSALMAQTHVAAVGRRYPRQISGGEQQRAALARALAIEPEALLLDEPLSALDTHLRSQMEAQLQETFEAYLRPALLVTHNIEEAYRLGEKLLVLSRGRVAAFGPKDEIFRRPPSLEVARLTGCKNFSRARAISEHAVEALDWRCQLKMGVPPPQSPSHIGIRAHHIDFVEVGAETASEGGENVFLCWLVGASETPFRITLYLKLHEPPSGKEHDLQVEVFKEKWDKFREKPLPWHVRLSPHSLFALPD